MNGLDDSQLAVLPHNTLACVRHCIEDLKSMRAEKIPPIRFCGPCTFSVMYHSFYCCVVIELITVGCEGGWLMPSQSRSQSHRGARGDRHKEEAGTWPSPTMTIQYLSPRGDVPYLLQTRYPCPASLSQLLAHSFLYHLESYVRRRVYPVCKCESVIWKKITGSKAILNYNLRVDMHELRFKTNLSRFYPKQVVYATVV